MAAPCIGVMGPFCPPFPHIDQHCQSERNHNTDVLWVQKRYTPNDLRFDAPVPRYKMVLPDGRTLQPPPMHWMKPLRANLRHYWRDRESPAIYTSQLQTRSEEWSTLRELLPSRGRAHVDLQHPRWGTGAAHPPQMTSEIRRQFPNTWSPMTRSVYTHPSDVT
ncbi:hypothetical protein NP493_57g01069 [Ridgeia piscesae]|uniref:Uncharacterized protein n=1 Tax=Ridgeia piscesae TaxID=27915 RepID=A0AAD9PAD6_RIDPI|nr:hypothetical protein NP493_57g01069 [Ridgeia piscesae]